MNMITVKEITDKLKRKDFTISYEEALDLVDVMDVDYTWLEFVGKKESKLLYIELNQFSGVKLYINEEKA